MLVPPWMLAAGGLLLAATTFAAGWQVRSWKADSDELEAVEAGIERGKEQQQLADYKAGRYEDYRHDAQAVALGRDTEIRTIYRTQNVLVPAECEPPATALRVLDAAISDTNAAASGEPRPALPTNPGEAGAVHRP